MITKNIKFKNFLIKKKFLNISKKIKLLLEENNLIFETLGSNYKYNYSNKVIKKFKKFKNLTIIGMGGSILGTQAIYDFLRYKIKKKVFFINNLNNQEPRKYKKKNNLNLIISKSGNTLETISNSNIFIKDKDKNIFVTENTNNYLFNLGKKLKAEIIEHKN